MHQTNFPIQSNPMHTQYFQMHIRNLCIKLRPKHIRCVHYIKIQCNRGFIGDLFLAPAPPLSPSISISISVYAWLFRYSFSYCFRFYDGEVQQNEGPSSMCASMVYALWMVRIHLFSIQEYKFICTLQLHQKCPAFDVRKCKKRIKKIKPHTYKQQVTKFNSMGGS